MVRWTSLQPRMAPVLPTAVVQATLLLVVMNVHVKTVEGGVEVLLLVVRIKVPHGVMYGTHQ